MATYRDLQDRINLDYLNQMTIIPEVKRAIATAIRCYETTRYWFNEAQTAVATSAGQSYIAVPTDLLALDKLELTVNSNVNSLRRSTFDDIRSMNRNSSNGQPTDYAYHGDRFELAAIPNSAYAATVYYIKSLPVLSADSDSNAWTNEASNLIAHAATLELMTSVLQVDDNRKIARHQLMLKMAQNELATRNDSRLLWRLRPTQF